MNKLEYSKKYHHDHPRLKYSIEQQVTDDGKILCYSCNQYKDPDQFDGNSKMWFRNYKERRCKQCKHKAYIKRLKDNNNSKTIYELLDKRYLGLKERAKRHGLLVNITKQYLYNLWDKQKGLCALSNVPMTFINNCGRIPTNVSIDRIDSNKGYIAGNIQLVCMAVNQMKNDLDMQTLLMFCNKIIENYRNAASWHHGKKAA